MKATCSKVPIAFKIVLEMTALAPEFKQLRDLLDENKTFYPDLAPLLSELNMMLDGWSAPIEGPFGPGGIRVLDAQQDKPNKDYIGPFPLPEVHTGPCKSEPDKPFVLYDETRDRLIALDKNSELGLR